MDRLHEFSRLRKQHDSIKIVTVLFICSVYFFISMIIQIVSYIGYVSMPAEYILEADSTSAALDLAPRKICEIDGSVGASFQTQYSIDLGESSLFVTELSLEYIFDCYGICNMDGGNKIWLNEAAFHAVFGETRETSIRRTYFINGETKNAEFIKCDLPGANESFAVTQGTPSSFADSNSVRVMFDKTDISGNTVSRLENMGYTVINKENILIESYERELAFTHVKYSVIITALSFSGAYAFVQIYKYKSKK